MGTAAGGAQSLPAAGGTQPRTQMRSAIIYLRLPFVAVTVAVAVASSSVKMRVPRVR